MVGVGEGRPCGGKREDAVELAELAVDGVLPIPAAEAPAPATETRAGVDVTAGGVGCAAVAEAAGAAGAAVVALATLLDPGVIEGGGRVALGGLINARGAFGGLNVVDEPDGEGGIRPPACTRVGPNDGDRSGVDVEAEPQVIGDGVAA